MAERVRQIMKRSTSKASSSRGSVNHIGTTPYRFKIDIFISYAENVKSITEACITWERRGKAQATRVVKVVDGKAVFRQPLSMECTLFRRSQNKSKSERNQEDLLNFDEKKAKMYLRKGSAQGKAVAKLALNISDYVKSATSTVFADMKLSDGTVVVSKVEATMIALDKKKKFGSWTGSGVSDARSVDDSLCGDEEDLENAQRLIDIPTPSETASIIPTTPRHITSPVTSASITPPRVSDGAKAKDRPFPPNLSNECVVPCPQTSASSLTPVESSQNSEKLKTTRSAKQRVKESEQMKESPSLKEKLKNKFKVSGKRDKLEKSEKEQNNVPEQKETNIANRPSQQEVTLPSNDNYAEVRELKKLVESLKKENNKLKIAKSAALEEIEALRYELKACEEQLEKGDGTDKSSTAVDAKLAKLQAKLQDKEKKIGELKSRNEHLLEEMEEQHSEMRTVSKRMEENDRERIRQEFARQEQAQQEQARLDQIRQEQACLDQTRLELMRAEQAHLEQSRLEQARLEQVRLEQARLEQVRLEQARLEQVRLEQAHLEQVRLEQARSDQARLEQEHLDQARREQAQDNTYVQFADSEEVITLRKKVADLEVALQREPTFMDVVNELKVLKMTVALANMEKEQALFEMQNMRQQVKQMESSAVSNH